VSLHDAVVVVVRLVRAANLMAQQLAAGVDRDEIATGPGVNGVIEILDALTDDERHDVTVCMTGMLSAHITDRCHLEGITVEQALDRIEVNAR